MEARRRSTHTPMPVAWQALACEWWGLSRTLTWAAWQALASCPWSEALAFRQQLLLWPTITTGKAAALSHHVTPAQLLHVVQLLRTDGRLTRGEAVLIEEAILAHVAADGSWK